LGQKKSGQNISGIIPGQNILGQKISGQNIWEQQILGQDALRQNQHNGTKLSEKCKLQILLGQNYKR
jgi:hypothetical protein